MGDRLQRCAEEHRAAKRILLNELMMIFLGDALTYVLAYAVRRSTLLNSPDRTWTDGPTGGKPVSPFAPSTSHQHASVERVERER